MKNILLAIFIIMAIPVFSQKIGGFYSGTLFNDSTKMVQKYELALDDYRGKITGYSYVTFVSNDTFYYGIRRVKGEIVGDSLIVSDDKMIANNFPVAPAKGVGRVITIPLKGQDSLVIVNGRWKTNQTKKYYSVPGAIDLSRSQDSAHSPLIGHLKELNLIASANTANVTNTEPEVVAATSPPVKEKIKEKKVKVKTEEPKKQTVAATPNIEPQEQTTTTKTNTEKTGTDPKESTASTKPAAEPKEKTVAKKPVTKTEPPVVAAPVKLSYDQRNTRPLAPVEITSDSLILAFYDNGVVDGDSISVYLNGQPVVQGARLTTVATKKTISIANMTDVELVLVAENLGRIPPNTGLLTIRDGDNIYQINFSADLQNNASIRLQRKKKQ